MMEGMRGMVGRFRGLRCDVRRCSTLSHEALAKSCLLSYLNLILHSRSHSFSHFKRVGATKVAISFCHQRTTVIVTDPRGNRFGVHANL